MLIPQELLPVPLPDQNQKVATGRKTIAAYHSTESDVVLAVNTNSFKWEASELDVLRSFYRASHRNLYDEIQYLNDTIKEIKGRSYLVFEFVGKIIDEENALRGSKIVTNYNYIQYTPYGEYILLFSFLSPNRKANYWRHVVKEIMENINLKE
jgi:hypothetical protein